jgi:hypothetical protein
MVAELDRLSATLVAASAADASAAKHALAQWIERFLVPHAAEEEQTSYGAAAELPAGRLLIRAMVSEHDLIRRLVALFAAATDPAVAGTYGRAIFEVFSSHQLKENEIILPLLVADESVSLVDAMASAHGHEHEHDHAAERGHHHDDHHGHETPAAADGHRGHHGQ